MCARVSGFFCERCCAVLLHLFTTFHSSILPAPPPHPNPFRNPIFAKASVNLFALHVRHILPVKCVFNAITPDTFTGAIPSIVDLIIANYTRYTCKRHQAFRVYLASITAKLRAMWGGSSSRFSASFATEFQSQHHTNTNTNDIQSMEWHNDDVQWQHSYLPNAQVSLFRRAFMIINCFRYNSKILCANFCTNFSESFCCWFLPELLISTSLFGFTFRNKLYT